MSSSDYNAARFTHGGGQSSHENATRSSQTMPSIAEQAQQAGDRLNDPQRAAGLNAAMAKVRLWAAEANWQQDPNRTGRSPLEQAEREELAEIAAQQARAVEQAAQQPQPPSPAPPPLSRAELAAMTDAEFEGHLSGQQPQPTGQQPQRPTTGDAAFDAQLDELLAGLDRFGDDESELDKLLRQPPPPPEVKPWERPIGMTGIEAKQRWAVEMAQEYNAGRGGPGMPGVGR
jgi:hypothetical protein